MAILKRRAPRKRRIVKLENHRGIHWPPGAEPNPPWVGPTSEFPNPLLVTLGEVELVKGSKDSERHLRLTGTYDGNLYRTSFMVDDPALLFNLFELLSKRAGETIGAIGGQMVDLSLKPLPAGRAA